MLSDRLYPRLLTAPKQSFFLFGMRGSGKSTWAQRKFRDAHRLDLLDEGLYQSYLRDPRLFGRELGRIPRSQWVIVDEVQRLPVLLHEIHRPIEGLWGSSARS